MGLRSTAFVFAHYQIFSISAHDAAEHEQPAFEGFEPLSHEQPVTANTRHLGFILSPQAGQGSSSHLKNDDPRPHPVGCAHTPHDQLLKRSNGFRLIRCLRFRGSLLRVLKPQVCCAGWLALE